jgi:hypothetical protein
LKLSVAEGHGGAAGILSAKDGHNYFSGRLGGMTFLTCPADKGLISQYKITQRAVDRFVLEGPFANGSILNERLTLANGALKGEFDVKGGKEAVTVPRCLSVPLNLGSESNVCWRSGDGEWIECAMQENEQIGFFTLKDAAKGGTPIEIASPKTGRAVRFTFGKDIPDNFMLTVYPEHGDLLLCAYSFSEIPAGGTQTVSFKAMPIAKADGLPESRRFVKSDKGRLFIEEYQMKMQSIRWGKIVADYRTGNGEALQLFNTHFEWCVQVMPDLSIFTPGVEYAVRFRIRVDAKPGKKGMAFWAGLYDMTNKTGLGQISPKVTEVDGEYHWFTIAKWVPNVKNNVMAWCGPGKFDDGDATSINAVYVDCMEIVPASEVADK